MQVPATPPKPTQSTSPHDYSALQRSMPYDAPWMYHAEAAWSSAGAAFLQNRTPQVLKLETLPLSLPLGPIAGPPSLGSPAHAKVFSTFNPAIAKAPANLCPRCAYVVALRADALHQCNATSPLAAQVKADAASAKPKQIATGAYFKGTALAVLDTSLSLIGWTWMLPRPEDQVNIMHNGSRWYVQPGVSDGFLPPWGKPAYDTRLLNLDGKHLFATFNCKACTFSVAFLELTGRVTSDGGITELRCWTAHRFRAFEPWAQGRNQALFALPPDPNQPSATAAMSSEAIQGWKRGQRMPRNGGRAAAAAADDVLKSHPALMVQPWLGLVASFGIPAFRTINLRECYSEQAAWGPLDEPMVRAKGMAAAVEKKGRRALHLAGTSMCGPTPIGGPLNATILDPWLAARTAKRARIRNAPPSFGLLQLVANHTVLERKRRTFDVGGFRVSPTANLIRIERLTSGPGGTTHCAAFLGVGHTHRGTGVLERRALRTSRERRADFSGGISSVSRIMGGSGLGLRNGRGRGRGRGRGGLQEARVRKMKNLIGKGGGKSEYLATKILEKTGRRMEEADAPEFSPFQFGFQYSHFSVYNAAKTALSYARDVTGVLHRERAGSE